LCPPFWSADHAQFREQTIIHEAVHLTHCAPHGNTERAIGIGWPECLAQFVVATNGKRLDPGQSRRCGFTKRCGSISEGCRRGTRRGGDIARLETLRVRSDVLSTTCTRAVLTAASR
jgi:hypothetical protein